LSKDTTKHFSSPARSNIDFHPVYLRTLNDTQKLVFTGERTHPKTAKCANTDDI